MKTKRTDMNRKETGQQEQTMMDRGSLAYCAACGTIRRCGLIDGRPICEGCANRHITAARAWVRTEREESP
jgi:hypothetical protein